MNDFSLRCKQYCPTENGEVLHYLIEVVYSENDIVTIPVKPNEISSHISMKKIFLNRNIFYSKSKKQHEKLISDMFNVLPEPI